LNGQRSGRAVALDLGIPHRTLRSWVKKLRSSVPARPQTPAQLQAQLRSARAELQSLRNQCEILKKNSHHSFPPSQRCQRVKELQPFYPITDLCAALGLSRSAYYAWLKRTPGPRQQHQLHLQFIIKSAFQEFKSTYGSPRLTHLLKKRGHRCNHKSVERLMRQQGLAARRRRAFRVRTTDSNHDQPISPNRLAERPPPSAINQVWVSDITYLRTAQGFLYLAGIMDLYSRKIVGWAMQDNLETSLTSSALQMALTHRQPH